MENLHSVSRAVSFLSLSLSLSLSFFAPLSFFVSLSLFSYSPSFSVLHFVSFFLREPGEYQLESFRGTVPLFQFLGPEFNLRAMQRQNLPWNDKKSNFRRLLGNADCVSLLTGAAALSLGLECTPDWKLPLFDQGVYEPLRCAGTCFLLWRASHARFALLDFFLTGEIGQCVWKFWQWK